MTIAFRGHAQQNQPLSDEAAWRLLDMVYANPAALWINLILSIAIGTMAFARMGDGWSAGWACFGLGTALARLVDSRSYAARRVDGQIIRSRRRFIVISSFVGVYWGCSSLVMLLSDDAFLHFWIVNAQTAALSIAVARHHSVAKAIKIQIVLSNVPLFVCLLIVNDAYYKLYSLMTLLYTFTLFAVARNLEGQTLRLLIADEQNAALLCSLSETNTRLEAANGQLQAMATTDGLTGLANRRRFDDVLRRQWHLAHRTGLSLSLLLIDIDGFKRYNDAFGHQAGDACLRHVAECLAGETRRPTDLAARYGGEEFAVILLDADAPGTVHVAERLRMAVEAMALPGPSGAPVTVSIGAATCWPADASNATDEDAATRGIDALIAEADQKLYDAKRAGRNCVRSDFVPVMARYATS